MRKRRDGKIITHKSVLSVTFSDQGHRIVTRCSDGSVGFGMPTSGSSLISGIFAASAPNADGRFWLALREKAASDLAPSQVNR